MIRDLDEKTTYLGLKRWDPTAGEKMKIAFSRAKLDRSGQIALIRVIILTLGYDVTQQWHSAR